MRAFVLIFAAAIATAAAKDDEWIWKEKTEKNDNVGERRYQIYENHENIEDFDVVGPGLNFRPQNVGPYNPGSRPIGPGHQGNPGVLVGPGGPTGIISRPQRPGSGYPDRDYPDGGIPPWIRDDPRYREYDTCRCRYSFNCPSEGLKFGFCAKDKRYCCFNSRRYPQLVPGHGEQGHRPYYPQGHPYKDGPSTFLPSGNYGHRQPHGNFNGHRYPSHGNFHLQGNNFNDYQRPYDRPYDRPYEIDIYARSLDKNQTATDDGPMKENVDGQ